MIVEQGAKFTELEYETLMSLQAKSQVVRDTAALQQRLRRLKDIVKEPATNPGRSEGREIPGDV